MPGPDLGSGRAILVTMFLPSGRARLTYAATHVPEKLTQPPDLCAQLSPEAGPSRRPGGCPGHLAPTMRLEVHSS